MASIRFNNVSRIYGDRKAVDNLDLVIADGEFLVVVGPSGCGKSTSLRMLAGLEPADEGAIFIGDRDATGVPPRERDGCAPARARRGDGVSELRAVPQHDG